MILPQVANPHPRCGVPRKITPAVDAAISLCIELCWLAETMACYMIKHMSRKQSISVATYLLDQIASKAMTDEDQWPMVSLRG